MAASKKNQLVPVNHWQDVSCMNFVIFRRYYRAMKLDLTELNNRIMLALGGDDSDVDPETITDEWLLDGKWVSLPQYQIVEDQVVRDLGHVFHLPEVGRYAQRWSFESPAVDILKRGLVPHVTEPGLGFGEVPKGTKRFNRNKNIVIVKKGRGHNVLGLKYVTGPGGVVKRSAQKDARSVLYYIVGVLRGVIDVWYKEDSAGSVRIKSADITPADIIEREASEAGISLTIDPEDEAKPCLSINGHIHGEVIDLPSGIRAFMITEDVLTPCRKCRDKDGEPIWHPILRKGEIYRYQEEIPTEYDIHWRRNRLFAFGKFVKGKRLSSELDEEQKLNIALMNAATARAETRAKEAEAETERVARQFAETRAQAAEAAAEIAQLKAEAEQARAEAEAAEQRRMRKRFEKGAPSLGVADALLDGTFEPIILPTIILQSDVKGYKRLSKGWGPIKTHQIMTRLFELLEAIARQYGFFPFKRIGDALIIAYADWPRRKYERCKYNSIEDAEDAVIEVAREFHQVAKGTLGLTLRVGIAKGDVLWCNQTTDPEEVKFDAAGGEALNLASRLEGLAKPGQSTVSESIVKSRESRPPKHRSRIMYRASVPDKDPEGEEIKVWDIEDEEDSTIT